MGKVESFLKSNPEVNQTPQRKRLLRKAFLIPLALLFLLALGLGLATFFYGKELRTFFGQWFGKLSVEEALKDPQKLKEFTIQPSDFDPQNVITFPEGGAISSDIISIKLDLDVSRKDADKIASSVEASVVGEVPFSDFKYFHIKFQKPKTIDELEGLVGKLRENVKVKSVAPYLIFESASKLPAGNDIDQATEPDPDPPGKWAFRKPLFPQAWGKINSLDKELQDVVIAVIDDGFDTFHEELAPNLLLNYNGYSAYDFGDQDTDVSHGSPQEYHGTAVAGVAGAAINGRGANGAAPTAKIFPLKIKSKSGGKANLDLAIRYASASGTDVINISQAADLSGILGRLIKIFGGFGSIEDAIKEASAKGIIVVAGVGNAGANADNFFPANLPEVIGVGGTDAEDQRWAGSNYSDNTAVFWVAAPAKNIYVPVPKTKLASGYGHDDGTSYSSPVVAGLAALLLQVGAAPSAIPNILRSTADDINVSYPDGSQHIWKRINAEKAVSQVISPFASLLAPPATTTPPPSATPPPEPQPQTPPPPPPSSTPPPAVPPPPPSDLARTPPANWTVSNTNINDANDSTYVEQFSDDCSAKACNAGTYVTWTPGAGAANFTITKFRAKWGIRNPIPGYALEKVFLQCDATIIWSDTTHAGPISSSTTFDTGNVTLSSPYTVVAAGQNRCSFYVDGVGGANEPNAYEQIYTLELYP